MRESKLMKLHHRNASIVGLLILVAHFLSNATHASEITYHQKGSFIISTTLDGKEYIAEELETEPRDGYDVALVNEYSAYSLRLIDQADWDEDGFAEALYLPLRGGNCCPDQYRLISYSPTDGFRTHQFLEAWSNPQIERLRLNDWTEDRWVFTSVENNEGWNTYDFDQVRKRYVIESGQPKLIEELVDEEIPATKEIRSYQVETLLYDVLDLGMIQNVDAALLTYDLNNDGAEDQIRGYLWERWGRMRFYVEWADGTQTDTFGQCKRIGVLESVTKGVHDLVCDNSDMYIWNGEKFQRKPNEAFEISSILN